MGAYFYEVELSWKSNKKGLLTSHGLEEIEVSSPVDTPREKENNWTPEHLLGASVSSSFMSTFLDIAANFKLEILAYHSQCFVKLERVKGKYNPREILLRPMITLADDRSMLKAYKCIEDAEGACPIRNVLKINVEVHPQFEFLNNQEKAKAS